jgi:beta-N-acetylhexosaminidase
MASRAQLVLSYQGPAPDRELLDWIAAGRVGGVVLFADNCAFPAQLAAAIAQLKQAGPPSLQVMIDEEGGRVRRLPEALSPMPALAHYGAADAAPAAARDYAAVCRTLIKLGVTTLLAPVLDVGTKHNTWLAQRTFSETPQAVAEAARLIIPAVQDTGCAACAKHFPGLGGVADDLHGQQFVVDDSLELIEQRDLLPFQAAIAAGVHSIMVSHAIYTSLDAQYPAVFSPSIIGGLLRRRLGFAGEIISDDLAMGAIGQTLPIEKAIELAMRAGCDRLLICNDRSLQRRAIDYVQDGGRHNE